MSHFDNLLFSEYVLKVFSDKKDVWRACLFNERKKLKNGTKFVIIEQQEEITKVKFIEEKHACSR